MSKKTRNITFSIATVILASLAILAMAEVMLRLFGLPKATAPIIKPPQFVALADDHPWYSIGHLNLISDTAVFQYGSNERGYFRFNNEVEHKFNSLGFRGPEFSEKKAPNTIRIAFFGDSMTMGEGVHFEDTYPKQTRIQLARKSPGYFESLNFGVSGYNTEQEEKLISFILPKFDPDVLVLGYFMNDPADRLPRTEREAATGDPIILLQARYPPPRLRVFRLVHKAWLNWKMQNTTIDYFQTLHNPDERYWPRSESTFREIGERCQEYDIPCVVVIFPILWDLQNYALKDEHNRIKAAFLSKKFLVLDVLEELQGFDANELRVHATDRHPNEIVHRIVGERLANIIASFFEAGNST
jgi:hypothetical protein